MSVFDLFRKDGRAQRARDANIKRAVNKYAQSPDRMKALQSLRDDGSPDALYGLLRRFGMMYDKTIEDEQEKEYVFDQLRSLGPAILPELEQHLRTAESISWGLRLLGDVSSTDQAWPILERLCEQNDNTYTRDPSKKTQLVHFLGESDDPRAGIALVPYLEDIDEGVRFQAVEGILRHKPEEARAPLLRRLVDDAEQSRRIKRRIVEGMSDAGWAIRSDDADVAGKLTPALIADLVPGSSLDKEGRVRRAAGK